MSQKLPNPPAPGHRPPPPASPPRAPQRLNARAVAALRELYRVCLGMDAEGQTDAAPSEEQYQAAMAEAQLALREAAPNTESPQ